jgi:subtilisin family serine protease
LESGTEAIRYGKGVSVAVLDSGIDGDHPFLRGKLVVEACFSMKGWFEREILHSACPSGDEQEIGVGAARPCPMELGCFHGTHVAGIVAGAGEEFTGVAAAADIVAVQVATIVEGEMCGELGFCATSFDSNIIRGLEWVYRNRDRYRIVAVNLSLGEGSYKGRCDRSPMRRIFSLLRQAGIVAIAASGNSGFENSMESPACLSEVVSVGATTYVDTVAPFSNSSAYLDFLAPGATRQPIGGQKGILSSVPGNLFVRLEGTSMAAPHVAGAFAALKSAAPKATVIEMIEAVRQTGFSVLDPRNGRSQPRIRVDKAIEKLRQIVATRPAKPAPKPEPKAEPTPKPKIEAKPTPKLEPAPKSENIDGIRIESDPAVVGEDGKIEW